MTKRLAAAPAAPLDTRSFADARAREKWLATHHAKSLGLWLKLAKKRKGVAALTYAQALEVALAWGWIDSHKKALDDSWWLQKFTPRRPQSLWSEVNRAKATALIEAGAMKPPGLAAVERAKASGAWAQAYAPQRTSAVPDELAGALATNARAAAFFATLESRNRYALLFAAADGEETGDARGPPGALRRDARARRKASPVGSAAGAAHGRRCRESSRSTRRRSAWPPSPAIRRTRPSGT